MPKRQNAPGVETGPRLRKKIKAAHEKIDKATKQFGAQMSTAELKRMMDGSVNLDLRELNRIAAGATITKSGKRKGRNPHVGIKIEETTNEERVRMRRKAREKKPGTVRAVHRRKKSRRKK
jgi:hypothetical protein